MADIELVIKIPEDTYTHLCNGGNVGASLLIENAIKNGTELPEHHERLIDADALKDAYIYECITECERCEHCSKDGRGCELLLNEPTILEANKENI